jgi:hypothetical protein
MRAIVRMEPIRRRAKETKRKERLTGWESPSTKNCGASEWRRTR